MLKQTGFLKRGKPLQSRTMLQRGTKRLAARRSLKARENPDVKIADDGVRELVFQRDKKCIRCGCIANLTPSHFHSRQHSATRWLLDNLDTLCTWCHGIWEVQKQPGQEYFEWKLKQLGVSRFTILQEKARMVYPESLALSDALLFLRNQLPVNI